MIVGELVKFQIRKDDPEIEGTIMDKVSIVTGYFDNYEVQTRYVIKELTTNKIHIISPLKLTEFL